MSKFPKLEGLMKEQYLKKLTEIVEKEGEKAAMLDKVHVRQEYINTDRRGVKTSTPTLQFYTLREWGNDSSHGVQDYLRRTDTDYSVMYHPFTDKIAVMEEIKQSKDTNDTSSEPTTTKRGRPKTTEQ